MAIFNTLRLTSIALAITIIPLAYSAEYALVADYLIDGYSDQLQKNKAIIVKDHKITEVVVDFKYHVYKELKEKIKMIIN